MPIVQQSWPHSRDVPPGARQHVCPSRHRASSRERGLRWPGSWSGQALWRGAACRAKRFGMGLVLESADSRPCQDVQVARHRSNHALDKIVTHFPPCFAAAQFTDATSISRQTSTRAILPRSLPEEGVGPGQG